MAWFSFRTRPGLVLSIALALASSSRGAPAVTPLALEAQATPLRAPAAATLPPLPPELVSARALVSAGRADEAVPVLVELADTAGVEGDPADVARIAVTLAAARLALGEPRTALRLVRRAVARSREGPPLLVLEVAREGEAIARRAGDTALAVELVELASVTAHAAGLESARPLDLAAGELPPQPMAPPAPPPPRPGKPLDEWSQRPWVKAFWARVERDPAYLPEMRHMKEPRPDHGAPDLPELAEPGVYVEPIRTSRDDLKTLSTAYGAWRLAHKLSTMIDDRFGLGVMYANATVLNDRSHPVFRIVYYLTKAATIASAVAHLVRFSPAGPPLHLVIIGMDKAIIDVVRKIESQEHDHAAEARERKSDRIRRAVRHGQLGPPRPEASPAPPPVLPGQ